MSTAPDALEQAAALIEAEPESARALTLYALVSTLAVERSGCMFKLTKLRELDPDARRLAYDLMEVMAAGGNRGLEWERTLERIHSAVRG